MTAYWVNTFRSITDADRMTRYADIAGTVMTDHGGRFLARGLPAEAFESGLIERTVIIEFPSVAHAVAAYRSERYQEALRVLGNAAQRDIRIVEALESEEPAVESAAV